MSAEPPEHVLMPHGRTRRKRYHRNPFASGLMAADEAPVTPARFAGHQEVLPIDLIRARHFTIAGCGAVGSVLSRLLARLGAHRFHLVDGDSVHERDLNCQIYTADQVGTNKAAALAHQIGLVHPKVRSVTSGKRLEEGVLKPGKQDILILAASDPELPSRVLGWLEPWEPADRPALWVTGVAGSKGGYWFADLKQGIPDTIPEAVQKLLHDAADHTHADRPATSTYAVAALIGHAILERLNIRPIRDVVLIDLHDMVAGDPDDLVIGAERVRPTID